MSIQPQNHHLAVVLINLIQRKNITRTYITRAARVAQEIENPTVVHEEPTRVQDTPVCSLGRENPLKKEMADHSNILA